MSNAHALELIMFWEEKKSDDGKDTPDHYLSIHDRWSCTQGHRSHHIGRRVKSCPTHIKIYGLCLISARSPCHLKLNLCFLRGLSQYISHTTLAPQPITHPPLHTSSQPLCSIYFFAVINITETSRPAPEITQCTYKWCYKKEHRGCSTYRVVQPEENHENQIPI